MLASFIAERQGKYVQAPGGLGGQCVDLVNLYLLEHGYQLERLNAADWASLPSVAGHAWVPNSPSNHPPAGSLVVWKRNVTAIEVGQYGHIAIVVNSDVMSLVTFDQDWPVGAPCSLTIHSYQGVAGWFPIGA